MDRLSFARMYLAFCSVSGLHPSEVIISAGGALLMLGLRDGTDDLDLDVSEKVYREFKRTTGADKERSSSHGKYLDVTDNISLHIRPEGIEVQEVEGVWIYSIADLIKQKTKLSIAPDRLPEKATQDKADIAALETMQ